MEKEKIIINLGSNSGKKGFNLYFALKQVATNCKVISISNVYSSRSLLLDDQENYYNISAKIQTSFNPYELLDFFKNIERRMGRIKNGRWQSRIIDIDIVDYNSYIVNDNTLTLPHYDLQNRSFFLKPLMNIDPEYTHPVLGITVSEMYRKLNYKYEIKNIGELKWP